MRYVILLLILLSPSVNAAELEWVRIGTGNQRFMKAESQELFVPWGFNYDHDRDGQLIEEYWHDHWDTIVADFEEMKALGANVVRVHLQLGAFMASPTTPREQSLTQLKRLVKLAESTELYLNVTGLGCYHKQDVPAWYDALNEAERWEAQAKFWEAVAKTCADSPAIFCYDLMNEPVVAGGDQPRDDWLGPGFGGKHFVQFVTLERANRDRAEVAKRWIQKLTKSIRQYDQRHLVTVGLVPWSLDRPGLSSGFVPEKIAEDLDFISVHLYPEQGKHDEALQTLNSFAATGKPVVIEETFPLKCGVEELELFIQSSRATAAGWFSFYWGKTPAELKPAATIPEAMTLNWLQAFQALAPHITAADAQASPEFHNVRCEGTYRHHLQGICVSDSAIFWSFTTTLVKTDLNGKLIKRVAVANHHGDLCYRDEKLYVAVNLGKFNDPAGNSDSWVYVYAAESLQEVSRHPTQEVFHGAGGISHRHGRFYVVGGLPEGVQENYVYEYDSDFKFQKKHVIASGHTFLGIQTAAFAHDRWWFGCYGDPKILLVTDADFKMLGRYEFDCSLGIEGIHTGQLLGASGRCDKVDGCSGSVRLLQPDPETGLKVVQASEDK